MSRPACTQPGDVRADAEPDPGEQDPEPARGRRLSSVPTWALLGGLFVLSFWLRFYWAVRDPAPWIFSDELH